MPNSRSVLFTRVQNFTDYHKYCLRLVLLIERGALFFTGVISYTCTCIFQFKFTMYFCVLADKSVSPNCVHAHIHARRHLFLCLPKTFTGNTICGQMLILVARTVYNIPCEGVN